MILIDTSIIISFWRTSDGAIKSVIDGNDICICGTVRAELYAGAKNDIDLQRIKIAISGFHEHALREHSSKHCFGVSEQNYK